MQRWVAVVGPGAIGALIAASLRQAGEKVLLVGRSPKSLRAIKQKGLVVTLNQTTRRLRGGLELTHRPKKRPGCEAVFVCVKSRDIASAARTVKSLLEPQTSVLGLL